MGKFKRGDKIRVTVDGWRSGNHNAQAGDVYVVNDVSSEGVHTNLFYFTFDEIELVPAAEATGTATDGAQADKPKFKVGDRVRVHGHPYYLMEDEDTGTIIGASDGRGDWDVELDNYGDYLSFLESELIHATLTIQSGKFYRTRDGRKVGPMRRWSDEAKHRWEADDDDLPYIWADDGTEIDSDIDDSADLVAEWTEPQSTKEILDELEAWIAKQDAVKAAGKGGTDYGSTAGFTVPLCAYDDEPGWYAAELGRAYADGYAAGLRAAA